MNAGKLPLDRVESEFSDWLQQLDDSSVAPDAMRAEAVKRLVALFMAERATVAAQAEELVAARNLIGVQADSLTRLRDYQRRVMNAAAPEGYAIVDEALIPGLKQAQTSADPREVGMVDRVLARLRLVKPPEGA